MHGLLVFDGQGIRPAWEGLSGVIAAGGWPLGVIDRAADVVARPDVEGLYAGDGHSGDVRAGDQAVALTTAERSGERDHGD
jgi:hypothetical protein